MSNRTVTATLRANVADFKAQVRSAGTSLDELAKKGDKTGKASETALGRMTQSMQLQREHWTNAGTTLTAFGVATTASLGASAKAAVDWESAFAGVLKTVDGSAAELAELEAGLRSMALELPASHAEIAAVAEAAGQLGIATPNVLEFTRTMIDLGEATNMGAEEAATSLARFVNIMGTSQSEFSNIGSTVVELGNNFATTESEIVAMSMRLAGAGAQLGLTEAEVLALATAMSSLGIESEAGGTAMSQTMVQMRNAVDDGGESLEAFATAAGMSSDAFQALFRESPAEAIQAVVTGLGEMEAQGINTSGVLSDMGATGLRQSDALRRLSGDASLLGEAFEMATGAYAENSALAEEAAQRYETVASQVSMAKNAIVDAAISLGSVFMPAIAGAADGVKGLAGWFAGLPDPIQVAIGGLSGLAGVASLAAGGFLLLAPRVMDSVAAFKALRDLNLVAMAGGLSGIASSIGKFALPVAAFAGVMALHQALNGISEGDYGDVDALADALLDVADGGTTASDSLTLLGTTAGRKGLFTNEITNMTELLDDLGPMFEKAFGDSTLNKIERFMDSPGDPVGKANEKIRLLNDALIDLWNSGDEGAATESYEQLVEVLLDSGMAADEAAEALAGFLEVSGLEPPTNWATKVAEDVLEAAGATEELTDETIQAAEAADELAAAAEALGISEEALTGIYDSQVRSLHDIIDARRRIAGEAMSQLDLERNRFEIMEALTEVAEHQDAAFDKLAGTFDVTNDAGWKAHQMSEAWTQAMWDEAEQMHSNGKRYEEIQARMEEMRAEYENQIDGLQGVGDKAGEVADQYEMIPEDIATTMFLDTAPAMHDLNGMALIIDETTGEITIEGKTVDAEQSLAELLGLVADSNGMVEINGDSYSAEMTLEEWLAIANDSEGVADLNADDSLAQDVLHMFGGDVRAAEEFAKINANDDLGQDVLAYFRRDVDRSFDEVGVGADTSQGTRNVDTLLANTRGKSASISVNANTLNFRNAVAGLIGRTVGTAYVNLSPRTSASIYASGGYVSGPGTATSDSIPAWLSNGEYVIKANSVAKYGKSFFDQLNAGRYAQGGYVSARSATAPVVNVSAPSMEGMQLTGSLQVGDALVPIIDGRIVAADRKKQIVGRRP